MLRFTRFPIMFFAFLSCSIFGQSVESEITKELQHLVANSNLPGFCVAIVNEGGVLYQKGFGYSDKKNEKSFSTQTIINLGSTSKAILGTAMVKAIENEKLTYDSEINTFLPFSVTNPFFKQDPILIKHLVTHSSSILDTKHYGKSYVSEDPAINNNEVHKEYQRFLKSHQKMSLEDFLFNILNEKGDWYKKKNFIKAKPGEPFEYANLNAALVGLVIEKATQKSLEVFSKDNIFYPLGMKATTWSFEAVDKKLFATRYFPLGKIVPNYGLITFPDGGLYSNVEDLSLFLIELIKAFNGSSTFLQPSYAKVLLPGDGDDQRSLIGMGSKSRNIGHAGSDPGVQTDIQFNADSKIGRVILCNVNAQDNEDLYKKYREIHDIIARHEKKLSGIKKSD